MHYPNNRNLPHFKLLLEFKIGTMVLRRNLGTWIKNKIYGNAGKDKIRNDINIW
jgi:hypothetical protein